MKAGSFGRISRTKMLKLSICAYTEDFNISLAHSSAVADGNCICPYWDLGRTSFFIAEKELGSQDFEHQVHSITIAVVNKTLNHQFNFFAQTLNEIYISLNATYEYSCDCSCSIFLSNSVYTQSSMDELLIKALKGSFSPEQAQREEAEAFLTKAEKTTGYLQALVMIWVNPSVCHG
jgi:hypothetical protein